MGYSDWESLAICMPQMVLLLIGSTKRLQIVQFSRSVVSDSLRPRESQHARPPCPSPTPGVHSDSCSSSQWCHPAISSSVVPFSCPQSLPVRARKSWKLPNRNLPGADVITDKSLRMLWDFVSEYTNACHELHWTGWKILVPNLLRWLKWDFP